MGFAINASNLLLAKSVASESSSVQSFSLSDIPSNFDIDEVNLDDVILDEDFESTDYKAH